MLSTDKITFHVISHTHWDREWYLPFETFRSELVDLINELLTILEQNNDFIFHLDGQSIILQDFLEIYPDKKELLKKFIKSKNILIGPWYVLSDQFLSSGEATIRNLLYGIRDVREFGEPMMVGYLPDQFGQIAQLPQILKGFNIHYAILGRGIQDGFAEHNWHSLNGDSVLTICMTSWYNNAQRIPEKNTNEYLDKIFEKQKKTSLSGHILLMNGCDHLFVQKDLPDVIKKITNSDKYEIAQSSLQNVFKEIDSLKKTFPIYFGELRDDNNKQILSGTLSSRVYLKLQNYSVQTKIEKILEPLATISSLLNKTKYPFEKLKYAWKLLIQNHAHDSICGCSIDDVHKEMEIRSLKVNQLVDKLTENIKNPPHSEINKEDLFLNLVNLTSYERSEVVEAIIEIPLGPISTDPGAKPIIEKEINSFKLFNDEEEISFNILEASNVENFVLSRNDIPLLQAVKRFKILLNVSMKPFSAKAYKVIPVKEAVNKNSKSFDNSSFKLSLNKNGTFNACFKDKEFNNLHQLTIEEDFGDEYNFEAKAESCTPLPISSEWKVIEENSLRKKLKLESDMITIQITHYSNTNRIDFKTKINSNLKNKRIRLHFPTNLSTNCIVADTPFGVIERARQPLDWKDCAFNQPLYNFIDHNNGKYGLSFFGGGLASYELYKDGNGFAVDLIRAVGRLSSVHSHAHLETPDAQCNREIEFNYSVYVHDVESDVFEEQIKHQVPILSYESKMKMEFQQLLNISPELVLSSFKRSEDNEKMFILRLFNPHKKQIDNCKLNINFPYKEVLMLNLNEEKQSFLDKNKEITFSINSFQIITLGILV